ncbi:MAG: TonB-dependent receptor, partial [FCB group bacterium]
MKIKIILYVLVIIIAPAYLFSSEGKSDLFRDKIDDSTSIVKTPEILVTAPRTSMQLKQNPAATSIVGQDVLSSLPREASVAEALMLVPGVRIDDQANGSRVHMSIRGEGILSEHGFRGIKVILDGIPLNDPTGFAPDLYDVDWENVSKIEVLRGSAAAFYGGGGTGGVLNIMTKSGFDQPEAFASIGSNGYWKGQVRVGGVSENTDYSLSLSRMFGQGYRTHSQFNADNIYGKINWKPSEKLKLTQIVSYTNYFNQNAEGLPLDTVLVNPRAPNPDAEPKDEYQGTERFTGAILGNYEITAQQNLSFNAYIRKTSYIEPGSQYIWHQQYLTPGASIQYNLHHGEGWLQNNISAGFDFQTQTINENTVNNLGSANNGTTDVKEDSVLQSNERIDQYGIGAFAIDRLELGKEWGVMLSLRYDKINNKLTDLMPRTPNESGSANFDKATARLGVAYTPMSELNLYANWGQGFLPPATEELISNPVQIGGFNTALSPSTSSGEEVGARGAVSSNLYYDVAFFYLTTDKDFDRFRMSDRPLETFYRNAGSSKRYGLEAFLSWSPVKPMSVQLAYTYSHFRYTAPDTINGNWLPNSPEHQLALDIS